MKINARTPRQEDLKLIASMVEACGVFNEEEIEVAEELARDCLIEGEAESGFYFVFAEDENNLLGYACYGRIPLTEKSYDLYWIVTSPHHQSRGVGGQLLQEVERRVGDGTLYAETSGKEIYVPARNFYLKNGFIEAGRFADFYKKDDDKVVYSKVVG